MRSARGLLEPGLDTDSDLKAMDAWNPMAEDFNSVNFNTYNRGPGSSLPVNRPLANGKHPPDTQIPDPLTLFLAPVPLDLTEVGLRNFIQSAQCKPTSIRIQKNRNQGPDKNPNVGFAFVEFASSREAQEALSRLNRRPPFNFNLRFAFKPGHREVKEKLVEEEFQSFLRKKEEQAVQPVDDSSCSSLSSNSSEPRREVAMAFKFECPKRIVSMAQLVEMAADKLLRILPSRKFPCSTCGRVQFIEHLHFIADEGQLVDPNTHMPDIEEVKCASCSSLGPSLKVCVKCKSVFYCTRSCQLSHWAVHEKDCYGSSPATPCPSSAPYTNGFVEPQKKQTEQLYVRGDEVKVEPTVEIKKELNPVVVQTKPVIADALPPARPIPVAAVPVSAPIVPKAKVIEDSKGDLELIIEPLPSRRAFKVIEPAKATTEGEMVVIISYGSSPNDFHVQQDEDKAAHMTLVLNEKCEKMKQWDGAEKAQVGSFCAALFSEDGNWYRAKILKKTADNKFDIKFIDYGNEETTDGKNLQPLDDSFYETPALAIPCSLHGVEPLEGGLPWSPKASASFVSLTDKVFYSRCKVIGVQPNGYFLVDLYEEVTGASLSSALIIDGCARSVTPSSPPPQIKPVSNESKKVAIPAPVFASTPKSEAVEAKKPVSPAPNPLVNRFEAKPVAPSPPCTPLEKVVPVSPAKSTSSNISRKNLLSILQKKEITSIIDEMKNGDIHNSVISFVLDAINYKYMLMFDVNMFCTIAAEIGEYCQSKTGETGLREDQLVLVKGSDSEWYRAHVLNVNCDNTYKVFMIDAGYIEEVSVAIDMPPKYFKHPSLIGLLTPANLLDISSFPTIREDEPTQVALTVVSVNDGEAILDVTIEGKNFPMKAVSHSLAVKELNSTSPIPTAKFETEAQVTVVPVYQDDGNKNIFYVLGDSQVLADVMEETTECSKSKEVLEAKVGLCCIAKSTADREWYRAVIRKADKNKCLVYYLDFGNVDIVPVGDIKPMTPSLMPSVKPAQAVKCQLSRPSAEALTKVVEAMDEGTMIKLRILSVDEDGSHSVSLL